MVSSNDVVDTISSDGVAEGESVGVTISVPGDDSWLVSLRYSDVASADVCPSVGSLVRSEGLSVDAPDGKEDDWRLGKSSDLVIDGVDWTCELEKASPLEAESSDVGGWLDVSVTNGSVPDSDCETPSEGKPGLVVKESDLEVFSETVVLASAECDVSWDTPGLVMLPRPVVGASVDESGPVISSEAIVLPE